MFTSLDVDKDGLISRTELAYWCVKGGVPLEDQFAAYQKSILANFNNDHDNACDAAVVAHLDFTTLDEDTTRQVMAECLTSQAGEGGGGGGDALVAFDALWAVLLTGANSLSLS